MKYTYLLSTLLIISTTFIGCATKAEVAQEQGDTNCKTVETYATQGCECTSKIVQKPECNCNAPQLTPYEDIRINVVGQGVAPVNTTSPAQAYALAKRAAIADSYRLLAEKVKGVHVEGQDLIKNMMVTRSTVRTYVDAVIRDANIQETTFKEGLCEIEMEIVLSYSHFLR
ncbi:MAG: LPP20 family lipoprotein [Campylobacterota bacterium]|nr:LPP20 family lipoprotein [Campylobacterota bacterium]